MIRNFSGTIHNSGIGYSYDAIIKDGYVIGMEGHIPDNVLRTVEQTRYNNMNNNFIALKGFNGWDIFNSRTNKVVIADDGGYIGLDFSA